MTSITIERNKEGREKKRERKGCSKFNILFRLLTHTLPAPVSKLIKSTSHSRGNANYYRVQETGIFIYCLLVLTKNTTYRWQDTSQSAHKSRNFATERERASHYRLAY